MSVEDNFSTFRNLFLSMYTVTPKISFTNIIQKNSAVIKFELTKDLDLSKNVLAFMMAQ